MSTALTVDSSSFGIPSMSDYLLNNIKTRQEEEYTEQAAQIEEKYQTQTDSLNADTDRMIKVMGEINNARLAMDNGQEGIDEIEQLLLDARGELAALRQLPGDQMHREAFDDIVAEINSIADRYAAKFNPIGRVEDRTTWQPNTIEYRDDLSANMKSILGSYVGSDFRITTDDGEYWIPDTDAQTIERYTGIHGSESTETGDLTSIVNGLDLVSYDEETGAIEFTAKVDEGDPVTVNGTLERGGLELMSSWFYGGLETDEDIDAALSAIKKAEATLVAAESQIQAGAAQVERSQVKIDEEMESYTEKQKDIMYDQLKEEMELQAEMSSQYQAMVANLDQMQSQIANYATVFASTLANNPFTDTTA